MAFPGTPQFPPGQGLQDGGTLNDFVHNTLSVESNLRAHAGGGQQFATLIDAVVNVITRVTTAGDSIQLPPTNGRRGLGPFLGGLQIVLLNSQSNSCQVFGNFFENSTVGGINGSVGISLAGGGTILLVCTQVGTWISIPYSGGGGGGGLPLGGGQMLGFIGFTTADLVVGAGTSQPSATLLSTQMVTVSSFPSGTGVRLPTVLDVGVLGPILLKNKDPSNAGLVYPPLGGQIDSYGVNNPVSLPSLDELDIAPDGVITGQWWS